jgi:energy-coupling factor transporter transmembrane protein EcfT
MIDLLAIDRWSTQRSGWLHRVSVPAKLGVALALIGALIVTREAAPLAVLYAVLVIALCTSRLPVLPVLGLSLLPVAMSAVFAVTRLGTTWESALAIVEKGAISSLTLLLVVSTTPSPELFRAIRRVMPGLLADMLFLAYRSIFILLGRALAARDALRLRGGPASPVQRLRRGGLIGALSVLRATELATDQYAAMRLRGYPGTRRTAPLTWRPSTDLVLMGGAALVLVATMSPVVVSRPLTLLALAPLLVVPLFLVGGSRWPTPR